MTTLINLPGHNQGPYYIAIVDGFYRPISLRGPHVNEHWKFVTEFDLIKELSTYFNTDPEVMVFRSPEKLLHKAAEIIEERNGMKTGKHNSNFDKLLTNDEIFRDIQQSRSEMESTDWPEWMRDMF